ncbi:MAG: serine/threonine-protein kinase [Elusimicrobia bacterium]|nr:serine/threonine-protein kinase [Elusimicrobiota bacterium]
MRARVLLLAAVLCGVASAQERAPLKFSPRHRDEAWAALSPAEKEGVRRFIAAAPDPARAEAQFVAVGWRLMVLRELQDNVEGLEPVAREQRRTRTSARLDAELTALNPEERGSLLLALGEPLRRAGYVAAKPETAPPAPAPLVLPAGPPPADYKEAVARAQEGLRRRDWDGALAAARFASDHAPAEELLASTLKAAALSMLGRHDEALTEIRTVARIKPKAAYLGGIHAFVLNRAGLYKEASEAADAAIAAQPTRAWTWYQLAYAQAGAGDRTGSLRSLEQAGRLDAARFETRRRRALAAADAAQLLAQFAADPGLEAAALLTYQPEAAARRRLLRSLAWPAAGAALLLLLFLLRKPFAAWLVRFGMAAAGTPLPTPCPTPISGMPPLTGPGLTLPGLPAGYRVLRQIGSGGMGAVYEAEDLSLQRRVAVKRMRDEIRNDPRERDRFLKEARTVAQLRHPSIVDIHGIFEHEGEVFLVFEYLDGKTLDLVVYENGHLAIPEIKGVLAQVCSALTYAHARGVIHRDLKPPNIMLTRDNRVKVMDFGVARQAHEALSRLSVSATVAGTPPYMAPESETGVVRAESDLYSLAVCLYEMLTGARPFDGTNAGMLYTKMNMVFTPPSRKAPGLPPALDAFFARALQADPEKRPRTAAEFLSEFTQAIGPA